MENLNKTFNKHTIVSIITTCFIVIGSGMMSEWYFHTLQVKIPQQIIPEQAEQTEKEQESNKQLDNTLIHLTTKQIIQEMSHHLSIYKDIKFELNNDGDVWWTTKDGYSINVPAEEIRIEQNDTYVYENAFQEAIKSKSYADIIRDFKSLLLKYGYSEDTESKRVFNNTDIGREQYIGVYTLDKSICVLSEELSAL